MSTAASRKNREGDQRRSRAEAFYCLVYDDGGRLQLHMLVRSRGREAEVSRVGFIDFLPAPLYSAWVQKAFHRRGKLDQ